MSLIVKSAFDDYQRGDRITDAAAVADVLDSHPHSVLRVADPDASISALTPAAAAAPIKKPTE